LQWRRIDTDTRSHFSDIDTNFYSNIDTNFCSYYPGIDADANADIDPYWS
jgi:hypothetical protein